MNKLTGIILNVLVMIMIISCNQSTKKSEQIIKEPKGSFEAVFIGVNDTIIPDDISSEVEIDRRLLRNLNLTKDSDFIGEKRNFYMHAMGSIAIEDAQFYHFKVTSSGGIKFKINNKDVVANTKIHRKETNFAKAYVDSGSAIFEVEYFSGTHKPHIFLEWSRDGENFETLPDELFSNLDAFEVQAMETSEISSEESLQSDNILTDEEKKNGWKLLFDGNTTNGWHTFNKPGTIGRKWKAKDGMLVFEGRKRFEFYVAGRKIELGTTNKVLDGGEDIVTDDAYENFELTLEWKISEAGNNGIFYTVQENEKYDECWKTSPEMQVLDNNRHKDGLIYKHRSGDLYDLMAFKPIGVKPQGEWNKVRIIKNKGKVEHWLNNIKGVSFDLNSEEWKEMISKSKFAHLKDFANPGPGKIGFQDHDNLVSFKNIKIKIIE
ncbi:3-keto-disaccharide hydrolase [Hyunsoonleella aestuarii]|uniref:3-keto-alpha-glucoside-1,2-lyase/3-keto-2-hydroxy-glucal hydratase domain-containing protein n=1 Tax=Hyunsoonleella aestuarii TaxID=912802 RepID=A0ABP8E892_9FLAO|nr:DUF1080 domain-containing protein [Hyunsoonleella aestuarii]